MSRLRLGADGSSIVESFFSDEYVESLKPYIQSVIDEALDKMAAKAQPVDFVSEFALIVPSYVIYTILGVPHKDLEFLTEQNAIRTNGSASAREASAASAGLLEYLGKLVDMRMNAPQDDLVSCLCKAVAAGKLDRTSAVQVAFLLLVAGNATMVNMIALGVATLAKYSDQLALLKADPGLAGNMVQELCRYHTASAMALKRVALQDIRLGGRTIRAGEGIIASNYSGNRDGDAFPDPDVFDIRRKFDKEPLAYGWGPHRCIAETLAKVELTAIFETLYQRFPNLKPAIPLEDVQYSPLNKDVGIVALPVAW